MPGMLPQGWEQVVLRDLEGVTVTCGEDPRRLPKSSAMVRAGDIVNGRIRLQRPSGYRLAQDPRLRCALRTGDLVVKRVGRVGEAARVTVDHENWYAAKSVLIIRAEEPVSDITDWIRIWLMTPAARSAVEQEVTAHVERTLSTEALRRLQFHLPPPQQRRTIQELFDVIENKIALNQTIADTSLALADSHHAHAAQHSPSASTFKEVTRITAGKRTTTADSGDRASTGTVAPREIYQSVSPYFALTGDELYNASALHVLVACREQDGAHTALSVRDVLPGRGVLAVTPIDPADLWWLWHELRAGGEKLSRSREGGKRVLSRMQIVWPEPEDRCRFGDLAGRLHHRAWAAIRENEVLENLRGKLLLDLGIGRELDWPAPLQPVLAQQVGGRSSA